MVCRDVVSKRCRQLLLMMINAHPGARIGLRWNARRFFVVGRCRFPGYLSLDVVEFETEVVSAAGDVLFYE